MKSPLLHKLGLLPRHVPRAKRRLAAEPGAYARTPPVFVNRALAAVASSASKTFRKGTVGRWVDEFTPETREQMRRVAGRMLVKLGHESSLEW